MMPRMRIEVMTAERAGDWLAFFDDVAFADNPEWAGCYCRVFEFPHERESWTDACARGENRAVMAESAARGDVHGFLAYDSDGAAAPIGWCRAGMRGSLRAGHSGIRATDPAGDATTLAAVCFVIAPGHRRKGVARALLTSACDAARSRGLAAVEGYALKELPAPGGEAQLPPEAELFRGPRGLFDALGFAVVGETERYDIMRLQL